MAKRRKQCMEPGCRKSQQEDHEYCEEHLVKGDVTPAEGSNGTSVVDESPHDVVQRLSENELMKFNYLRLQQEHSLQTVRVLELEQERADRDYVAQKHTRTQMITRHRQEVEQHNNVYLDYVTTLGRKYGLDPKQMGIDDETGVLRDLRPKKEDETANSRAN